MIRSICPLLTYGMVLLLVSGCYDDFHFGKSANDKRTSSANENKGRQSELVVLPLALSQNVVPKTPTLALLIEASSDHGSQTVNAHYDEPTATWVTDINVLPGNSNEFVFTWSEKVRDQSLTLAQARKVIAVPSNIKRLNLDIPNDEYTLSFDADADGLSNLSETTNSTNPFDSSNPRDSSDAVVRVEFNIKLDIPSDLADSVSAATIQPTAYFNGKELTLSFDSDVDKQLKRVSDAEFDSVLEKFGALSHAIENKDADALDRLATSSEQSDLFKQLIKNNYDRIEVSIKDIRLRNIDKSVTGTLEIESLIHPNGDRSSLSEKYTSRTITSRNVDGDWSKIEW